jgi:hypothetical protein
MIQASGNHDFHPLLLQHVISRWTNLHVQGTDMSATNNSSTKEMFFLSKIIYMETYANREQLIPLCWLINWYNPGSRLAFLVWSIISFSIDLLFPKVLIRDLWKRKRKYMSTLISDQ